MRMAILRIGQVVVWVGIMAVAGDVSAARAQTKYSLQRDEDIRASAEVVMQAQRLLQKSVSIVVRDSTVLYVIEQIAKQSNVRVAFDQALPAFKSRVSVNLVNTNVSDALTAALKGTGLIATVASDGQTILIRPRVGSAKKPSQVPDTGVVAGLILDSVTSKPIRGVAISVVGLRVSAVSGDDGRFAMKVPGGGQTIRVQILGYKLASRSITVTKDVPVTVQIKLASAPTTLSGVVTTATGLQRKVEVGNDITSISVEEVIRNNPVSNVSELLATRVPGLYAAPTSGQPGAPTRIRIRGVSSVNSSNEPIIVVDGVQIRSEAKYRAANVTDAGIGFNFSPLDQLDINSIETVEVLKGPSAVALYGSDAANGVIVVTMKRGSVGPTRWNAAMSLGASSLPGQWPNNYFSWGTPFIGGMPMHCPHGQWNPLGCTPDSVTVYQILNSPNTTVFGRGLTQEYSVGVNGGVKGVTYSLTTSMKQDLGLMKMPDIDVQLLRDEGTPPLSWQRQPQAANQQSGTGIVRMDFGPVTSATLSTGISRTAGRSTPLSNALQTAATFPPPQPVYDANGSLATPRSGLLAIISAFREERTSREVGFRNSLTLQTGAISNTNTMISAGIDSRSMSSRSYLANGDCYGGMLCRTVLGGGSDSSWVLRSIGSGVSADIKINMSMQPLGHRLLNVIPSIGGNFVQSSEGQVSVNASGLPDGMRDARGGAARQSQFDETQASRNTVGAYLETRINVADRFWFPLAIRTDAGSALGGNVMPKFPKLGFSYLLSDQPNFRQLPIIGNLPMVRLRTAFGTAGKQPDVVAKYRTYKRGSNEISNNFDLNSLGNTMLKPERSQEWELGFDSDVIEHDHGSLSFTATWARKRTHDLLVQGVVPGSIGAFSLWQNLGDIDNATFEFSVDGSLQSSLISWRPSFNVTTLRNRVIRLTNGKQSGNLSAISGLQSRNIVGYPLYGRWASELVGYNDRNHDGIIDIDEIAYSDSAKFIGAPYPKFTANTQQQLTAFANLTFSAVLSYEHGLTQVRSDAPMYSRAQNDPSLSLKEQAYGLYSALTRAQQVSTLRWTSMQISYLLPHTITQRALGTRTASVALYGTNVGLWSTYRGKDPNVGATGEEVFDQGQLPQPRVLGLSLRIN